MKQKITKRTIEQIMPVSKEPLVYDTEVNGLHLKLYPSGKASFHLYYRTPDRIERRPKLGQYPAMTPELARSAASEMLLTVMSGKDPKSHKELRNHATVSSAVAGYISRLGLARARLNWLMPVSKTQFFRHPYWSKCPRRFGTPNFDFAATHCTPT